MARRLGVPAVAAVVAVLGAGPALAGVTVTPPSAAQGSGENLTFHVTNTGTLPLGTVTLRLPDDTPVAEVYPLSNDDWAPKIEMRPLSTPLATIHGGSPVTETAGAITWLAMPGSALAPGRSADLAVAIGPLPALSSMRFTLETAYADGKPGPVMPASLTLTPEVAGQAADAHAGHGTAAPATGAGSEDAAFRAIAGRADRGPSFWSIAGWVVAALALLGVLLARWRGRHRAEEDDEPDEDEAADPARDPETREPEARGPEAREPAAAGRWSYRG
jgi:uncharacterized protein DUF1775